MISRVKRYFLEIKDFSKTVDLNLPENFQIILDDKNDFQLNKFFYKNIGKKHKWIDRLVWTENQWMDYVSSEKVKTYILKYKVDLAGFFELIFHSEENEVEIAYFGILEEFQNKKLGSYLLSQAIQKSFQRDINSCLLYTSPSPRDMRRSRMPSSA